MSQTSRSKSSRSFLFNNINNKNKQDKSGQKNIFYQSLNNISQKRLLSSTFIGRKGEKLKQQCTKRLQIIRKIPENGKAIKHGPGSSIISLLNSLNNVPQQQSSQLLPEQVLNLGFGHLAKRLVIIKEASMQRKNPNNEKIDLTSSTNKKIQQQKRQKYNKTPIDDFKDMQTTNSNNYNSNNLVVRKNSNNNKNNDQEEGQANHQQQQQIQNRHQIFPQTFTSSDNNKKKSPSHEAAILITTNIDILVNLSVHQQNYEKKTRYKIKADMQKAIKISQYFKGDVKVLIQSLSENIYSHVKLKLQWLKADFGGTPNRLVISPKKKRQQIDEYIRLNRGRSVDILKQRSQRKYQSQRIRRQSTQRIQIQLRSRRNSELSPMMPSSSPSLNKLQIKQYQQFQAQKLKLMTHLNKMSPQMANLLQESFKLYQDKKLTHTKQLASYVHLARFMSNSRLMVLRSTHNRLHKIKIGLLCMRFCHIMKSKLRFNMTQKARYRITVLQPLAFLGEIFYQIQKPRADAKIFQTLMKVEMYKTGKNTLQKSKQYVQQTIKVQRYFRKKRLNYLERISILIMRLSVIYGLGVNTNSASNQQKHASSQKIVYNQKFKKQIKEKYYKKCVKLLSQQTLINAINEAEQEDEENQDCPKQVNKNRLLWTLGIFKHRGKLEKMLGIQSSSI